MKYRHLFFDLDHTLWDFATNARETLYDLYRLNSLADKNITDFDQFFERYHYHNERLWERYTRGQIRQDELRWKRMWLTLLDFKLADESLSRKMAVEFLERLPYKKALFPYTFEILTYLKKKEYRLHLITNGFDQIQQRKLHSAGLEIFFEEIITSEKSNSLKPNPEIFEFALRLTRALPEESIMIGDNEEADIRGAMNAGIDSVFVNHLKVKPGVKPTFMVFHLKELEEIF